MATKKNLELIDDIRTDALILMKQNPDLNYLDAYEQARKELIGDESIINYVYEEFSDNMVIGKDNIELEKKDKEDDYYETLKAELKDLIDVDNYSEEQLIQYMIGKTMGLDINRFANPVFTPDQIKFLCIALVSGENIDRFIKNPSFDADSEMRLLQKME